MERKIINKTKVRSLIRESIKENLLLEGDFYSDRGDFSTLSGDNAVEIKRADWEDFDPTLLMLIKDGSEKAASIFENIMEKFKFREKGLWSKLVDSLTKIVELPLAIGIYSGKSIFELFKKVFEVIVDPFRVPQYAIEQTIINISKVIGTFIKSITGAYGEETTSNASSQDYLKLLFDKIEAKCISGFFTRKSKYERNIVKLSKSNNKYARSLEEASRNAYVSFFIFMPNSYNAIATGVFKGFRSINNAEKRKVKKIVNKLKSSVIPNSYEVSKDIFSNNNRELRKIINKINHYDFGYENNSAGKRQFSADLAKGLEEILTLFSNV